MPARFPVLSAVCKHVLVLDYAALRSAPGTLSVGHRLLGGIYERSKPSWLPPNSLDCMEKLSCGIECRKYQCVHVDMLIITQDALDLGLDEMRPDFWNVRRSKHEIINR